jgi:hypothetical protein
MDGHPRQNPAYRPATERALVTGLFLWTRFARLVRLARGGPTAVSVNRPERSPGAWPREVAYRVAIDDLLDWSEANQQDVLEEVTIVNYLRSHEAARGSCAGNLLPALSPLAQVPPVDQPRRMRPRPIRRPRAAAEVAAGARLADPSRAPSHARRRGPSRAEHARPRLAGQARAACPRQDGTPPLRALRAPMARPRARRTEAVATRS